MSTYTTGFIIVSLCPDQDLEEEDQTGHGPQMFQKFNILMPLQVQESFTPLTMFGYGGITLRVGGRGAFAGDLGSLTCLLVISL